MLAAALALALASPALPPAQQTLVVEEARKALGVPYELGGRLRTKKDGTVEGLDCQGLVFFALQPITKCGWKSWSVMPTESVRGEMGTPVSALAPLATADLAAHVGELERGDIVWFLSSTQNVAEPALAQLDGKDEWVWHVGLYVGDGKVITGDPFASEVHQDDIVEYVTKYYEGIYVTRLARSPRPSIKSCRSHAKMALVPPPPPRSEDGEGFDRN